MLSLADGALVLAATDLADYLACPHLTQQRLAIARGERGKPRPADDPHADLIRRRGHAHEREQREQLSAQCGGHVDLSTEDTPHTREQLVAATTATTDAMRAGEPLIYQGQLFDGHWQGRADFLRSVPIASNLGPQAYEVVDTKLAREVKPQMVHQLSVYNRLLAKVQGHEPRSAHIVLGDGTAAAVDLSRYAALHRYVAGKLERVVALPGQTTYPDPVAHCPFCALAAECRARWVADDHLSLLAGVRREQREQLVELGLPTVRALAHAPESVDPGALGTERFGLLRGQAALQVASRESGEPRHRHLPPIRAGGYALLPDPSPGDVFFDLEGDPYVGGRGLEYLWGWWNAESGYECVWAHHSADERAALKRFVARVAELHARYPQMRVYHYAPHERSKLRSLSVQYSTCEDEVDDLLRGERLVDLYAVVRQAMQMGEESYSLKALERHHGFTRLERRVREGGGSIVAYEAWLDTRDEELLDAIRAYNEEDCRSTASLRDWLLHIMRPEAESELDVHFDEYREPEPADQRRPPSWMSGVRGLMARLEEKLPADGHDDSPDQAERRLLSQLLLYHHRDRKPAWWRHFDLRGKPLSDLIDDRDALAGLVLDASRPPAPHARSLDYTFTFPVQDFRLDVGPAEDPTTGESHNVVHVAEDHVILRRLAAKPPPTPTALVPGAPVDVRVQREALIDLAHSVIDEDGRFAAARAILRRERPRLRLGNLGEDIAALTAAALGLDRSVLPIQGPPGTGKTYNGAKMILSALDAGRRVGITALSHAAIQYLLRKVEERANKRSKQFAGIYKGAGYTSPHGFVKVTGDNAAVTDAYQLVAGTAWLFTRFEHLQAFDLIFIDEAGQFALADAAAVAVAARNLVLLGDPQQLPQVTQADHPDGAGASVLEHLLDGASTMPVGHGVLLTESWRMHPAVCAFVSERSYDSRLHSRSACALRRVDAPVGALSGTGLRALAVEHEGRSQTSPEEADGIASACRDLLVGATVTDDQGDTRALTAGDILVVAPYNLAVRTIRDRVPAGVRVGTVDRFQGQQAPVVFYAMTCSSGEDVPRGIDFLFDEHRFNVAISRAQCLAVLVYSPRLLDTDCTTLATMARVDGICRFVEISTFGISGGGES